MCRARKLSVTARDRPTTRGADRINTPLHADRLITTSSVTTRYPFTHRIIAPWDNLVRGRRPPVRQLTHVTRPVDQVTHSGMQESTTRATRRTYRELVNYMRAALMTEISECQPIRIHWRRHQHIAATDIDRSTRATGIRAWQPGVFEA